jgi:hypothetical protein
MEDLKEDLAGTPPAGEYTYRLIIDAIGGDALVEVVRRLEPLRLDHHIEYVKQGGE